MKRITIVLLIFSTLCSFAQNVTKENLANEIKPLNEKIISLIIVLILKIRLEWVQILFHLSPRLCDPST